MNGSLGSPGRAAGSFGRRTVAVQKRAMFEKTKPYWSGSPIPGSAGGLGCVMHWLELRAAPVHSSMTRALEGLWPVQDSGVVRT